MVMVVMVMVVMVMNSDNKEDWMMRGVRAIGMSLLLIIDLPLSLEAS